MIIVTLCLCYRLFILLYREVDSPVGKIAKIQNVKNTLLQTTFSAILPTEKLGDKLSRGNKLYY